MLRASPALGVLALLSATALFSMGRVDAAGWSQRLFALALCLAMTVVIASLVPLSRYPTIFLLVPAAMSGAGGAWLRGHDLSLAGSVLMGTAATLVGFALAQNVIRLTWVIPLGLGAAASDIHSVYFGTTGEFLNSDAALSDQSATAPTALEEAVRQTHPVDAIQPPDGLLDYLVLYLPSLDSTWRLGSIDIMFASLFLALSQHFRLPMSRTLIGLGGSWTAALMMPVAVPVIPFLAAGFVAAHASQLIGGIRHAARQWALSHS